MNVLFLEPAFPSSQRDFVRALASIGANVYGIGERPYEWFDDELKSWLKGYQQVRSVVDEGALEWAVREAQKVVWVDRLEVAVEAHVMAPPMSASAAASPAPRRARLTCAATRWR